MKQPLLAVVIAASFFSPPAEAGNNFGGTAVLSWSAVAEVSDLTAVPQSPAPLYLLLNSAPDIRQLAVELKWSPDDLVGPCYYLISRDSSAAPCGSTSYPLDPPGVFDGDSAYTWRISFTGPSRSCVTYLVGGEHCDGEPASFCLISVKTLDSNGEIDELTVLGNATILGGTEGGCPVVAQDIYPHVATAGGENTFTIQGRDFTPATQVALVDDGVAAPATSVAVTGDTTATASVAVPSGFSGALDVIISTAQSADTLRGRVVVADSSNGLPAVWQLDVAQDGDLPRAAVTTNEFLNPAYSSAFPATTVRIIRRIERAKYVDGQFSPDFTIEMALLDVDLNGRPVTSSPPLVSSSAVSADPWTGKVAVLAPSTPLKDMRPVPPLLAARAVRAAIPPLDNDMFVGWECSPDQKWTVIRTERRTQIQSGRAETVLLGRSYEGVFSRDSQRYAAVVEDARGRRWVVLSPAGILREGEVSADALSQVALSATGRFLTYTQQQTPRDPARVVTVDLSTGLQEVLSSVPEGPRYYSADGRTMAVLRASPGRLQLFDVSDPMAPVEITPPFDASGGLFITAAVSGDGGLVAVQVLEEENNPQRTLSRVTVLDRSLQQRASVIRGSSLGGLQFEGRFLLVGTQSHPIPTYFLFNPTTQIKLYDLSGL